MAQVIRFTACQPVPWKNGAGATRELWKLEDAAGVLIRISVAEITGDQPFSSFPGIDRVILQLEGPAMRLNINGQDCPLMPLRPQAFVGEAVVRCRLEGQGRALDLNLMCRRKAFRPTMERITLAAGQGLRLGGEAAISALLALTPCHLSGAVEAELGRYDLLLATAPAHVIPRQDAQFIVLTATP